MKGKIETALKTKYKNLGFDEKTLNGVADYLSKTVTEESQIDTAVLGVESMLRIMQSENDRRANELRSKISDLEKKLNNPSPSGNSKQTAGGDGDSENTGAGAGAGNDDILNVVKTLQADLEKLKSEEKQRSLRAQLSERLKDKKIPSVLIENVILKSDDDLDEVVKTLEEKSIALKQELIDQGVVTGKPQKSESDADKSQIIEAIKANPIIKKDDKK